MYMCIYIHMCVHRYITLKIILFLHIYPRAINLHSLDTYFYIKDYIYKPKLFIKKYIIYNT